MKEKKKTSKQRRKRREEKGSTKEDLFRRNEGLIVGWCLRWREWMKGKKLANVGKQMEVKREGRKEREHKGSK